MSFYDSKSVLVTGAGGTIGSELCRQLLKEQVKKLVLFEHSELALYEIERELADDRVVPVLGDVSDVTDVNATFYDHPFDIVFHAAAYKHVTMCEKNQTAAWRVNLYGTNLLLRQAQYHSVSKFILISTDKAVRPTCTMGETKRQAERATLEEGYTVVRLGNVLSSSGSVVPLWREQIAAGEPVTITDPAATRYWLTLPEAARRILQAGEIARGGEVFVPDMGKPVSILNTARALGATTFEIIGLRPGEKLHEELTEKPLVPTEYGKIWREVA